MKITIVFYNAFDQPHTKAFLKGEDNEQIFNHLNKVCDTFHITAIITATDAKHQPLSSINQFKKS